MFSMAKLRRCSPLFSCSLLFVAALLLFGGLVQCAKVGAGKHELDGNGKISKLGSNMVMVKEGADLSSLKNLPEACHDVEWDGKEWIKILYKKDGAAKEGCVLDLVAEEKPELKVYIGVKFSNNKCLKGYHNMLPFTYSLGGGQFEKLKDGKNQARRGESGDCGHERQCLDNNGYCLKVADFMVGFGRDREYIMPMLTLVDEPNILFSTLDGKKVYDKRSYKETFKINMGFADNFGFTLNIDNDNKEWSTKIGDYCLDDNQGDPFCFSKKHLRTIKHWEITDESHTDKQFKYLFTFYLLPQKAARSGGDIKTSNNKRCNIYSRRLEDEMLDGPNCDYLFIKLSTEKFKLLVPEEKPTTTPKPIEPTTPPIPTSKPPPTRTSQVDSKPPKRRKTTETPSEGTEEETEPSPASKSSRVVVIVIITVIVFMIVLIIIGCLVWLLVCRKKEEEEEQPLEDYFGTPGITGTGGTVKTTTEVTEERPTVGDTQNKTGYFDKASEDYDNTFKRDGT